MTGHWQCQHLKQDAQQAADGDGYYSLWIKKKNKNKCLKINLHCSHSVAASLNLSCHLVAGACLTAICCNHRGALACMSSLCVISDVSLTHNIPSKYLSGTTQWGKKKRKSRGEQQRKQILKHWAISRIQTASFHNGWFSFLRKNTVTVAAMDSLCHPPKYINQLNVILTISQWWVTNVKHSLVFQNEYLLKT